MTDFSFLISFLLKFNSVPLILTFTLSLKVTLILRLAWFGLFPLTSLNVCKSAILSWFLWCSNKCYWCSLNRGLLCFTTWQRGKTACCAWLSLNNVIRTVRFARFYNKVMRSWFKIFMRDPLLHNEHKIDDLLTNHICKWTEENLRCYRKSVYYRREDNGLVVLVSL